MKQIENMKGQILRIWAEEELIEDELDRTFEIVGEKVYEFEEGYPIPSRAGVIQFYCTPQEGGKIRVAHVKQLTGIEGELIWGSGRQEFKVIGEGDANDETTAAFLFLPFEVDGVAPPGGYMSMNASLPIAEPDGYIFALRFMDFFDVKATLQNVNGTMADLMIWLIQMYKVAKLNSEDCEFARQMHEFTSEDDRWANVREVAKGMPDEPFTAQDVGNYLMGIGDPDADSATLG